MNFAKAGRRHARDANLTYVSCTEPGFTREGRAPRFYYLDACGKRVTNAAVLARIRALAIPPAWKEVWISSNPDGHLQATGRDVKGRKQYRYHARWREVRDRSKFGELVAFAHRLPSLRRRIERDLGRTSLDKPKVLATVVSLIEKTHARVGNDRYARENGSFGITTLRDRHARPHGSTLELEFRAKSGKLARIAIDDRRLARIVKRCRDIPGQRLFQYVDERGERHAVTSTDVNRYIFEATGERFTAKTFRTWAGTLSAALLFERLEPCTSQTDAKRKINRVLSGVAEQLGNTKAVCRKSYVHPHLLLRFADGTLRRVLERARRAQASRGQRREEAVMIAVLEAIAKPVLAERRAA